MLEVKPVCFECRAETVATLSRSTHTKVISISAIHEPHKNPEMAVRLVLVTMGTIVVMRPNLIPLNEGIEMFNDYLRSVRGLNIEPGVELSFRLAGWGEGTLWIGSN